MLSAGIVDPAKVVRVRSSGRGVDRRPLHHHRGDGRGGAETGKRADARRRGGMGGMGGMDF